VLDNGKSRELVDRLEANKELYLKIKEIRSAIDKPLTLPENTVGWSEFIKQNKFNKQKAKECFLAIITSKRDQLILQNNELVQKFKLERCILDKEAQEFTVRF
jgi:DNA-binding transcriptional MerR regulator